MKFAVDIRMVVDLDAIAADVGDSDPVRMQQQIAACEDDSWLQKIQEVIEDEIGDVGMTFTVTRAAA